MVWTLLIIFLLFENRSELNFEYLGDLRFGNQSRGDSVAADTSLLPYPRDEESQDSAGLLHFISFHFGLSIAHFFNQKQL